MVIFFERGTKKMRFTIRMMTELPAMTIIEIIGAILHSWMAIMMTSSIFFITWLSESTVEEVPVKGVQHVVPDEFF